MFRYELRVGFASLCGVCFALLTSRFEVYSRLSVRSQLFHAEWKPGLDQVCWL